MIPELGHFALVLALALALIQATVPMFGARRNDPVLMGVAAPPRSGNSASWRSRSRRWWSATCSPISPC